MVNVWRVLLLAVLGIALQSSVHGATTCAVLDPELQGSYLGGCVNGYAEGAGEARGQAHYRGEFKAGRKHGKGMKSWPSTGDRYEGDFVEDRKEGTGTYLWGLRSPSAGQRYTGDYLNDRRHGQGVYEWPSGDRYAGAWENDAITGALTKGMITRARAQTAHAAVAGIAGAKVCREMRVGVATEDLVRGTVLAREGENIRVRIDHPGKFEHVIGQTPVVKGAVVSDPLTFWIPCV